MARDCIHGSLARSCELCELTAEVDRLTVERDEARFELLAFRDEVEHAVNGGYEPDVPLPGMEGLDSLEKINVLHSTAVEVARLRAGVRDALAALSVTMNPLAWGSDVLRALLDDQENGRG